MGRFTGRTVLVTGASRGLGQAIAAAFGGEGAFVYVAYRSHERGAAQTLEAVRAAGGEGAAIALDVRDGKSVDAAIERALAERGALDVLVNNAAVTRDNLLALMAPDDWDEVLATNLGGVFRCTRAVVRSMLARGRGAIINVGSVAGLHASPGQASYAASKGGVLALTRTLAAELAPKGIRVNAVVPGLVSTGMAARLDHRVAARRREAIPLGRFGTADEIARAVLFLASDDASYIIGQALVVDGGLTL